jgi:hypothetical protein
MLPKTQKTWSPEDGNADLAMAPSNLFKQDDELIFRRYRRIFTSGRYGLESSRAKLEHIVEATWYAVLSVYKQMEQIWRLST